MRIGVEATSMLGPRTGVGQTAAEVVDAVLAARPDVTITLLAVTARRGAAIEPRERLRVCEARLPARATWRLWRATGFPPAEWLCGRQDVFWGPNFALPPLRRAAGVVTVHDLAFVHMPQRCSPHVRTYAKTVPPTVARAARVVTPSRAIADEVAAWLPDHADRVRVVPPGIRPAFAAGPRPPAGDRPSVVSMGTLEERKNLDGLLTAFASVSDRASLTLIGAPGVGWGEIADRHRRVLEDVEITGYVTDDEAAERIRRATVFVYPSFYEGFGMPPLEALACGTRVISGSGGALTETLGSHAVFVDTTAELADALRRCIDEPWPDDERDAAVAWASRFTWDQTARLMLDVFDEARQEVA